MLISRHTNYSNCGYLIKTSTISGQADFQQERGGFLEISPLADELLIMDGCQGLQDHFSLRTGLLPSFPSHN